MGLLTQLVKRLALPFIKKAAPALGRGMSGGATSLPAIIRTGSEILHGTRSIPNWLKLVRAGEVISLIYEIGSSLSDLENIWKSSEGEAENTGFTGDDETGSEEARKQAYDSVTGHVDVDFLRGVADVLSEIHKQLFLYYKGRRYDYNFPGISRSGTNVVISQVFIDEVFTGLIPNSAHLADDGWEYGTSTLENECDDVYYQKNASNFTSTLERILEEHGIITVEDGGSDILMFDGEPSARVAQIASDAESLFYRLDDANNLPVVSPISLLQAFVIYSMKPLHTGFLYLLQAYYRAVLYRYEKIGAKRNLRTTL